MAAIPRASVIGDGAMGTVCAMILADHGTDVVLWSNFEEQAAELQSCRENKRFLPGHKLKDNIRVTSSVDEAFADPQLIISAVPCQFIRKVWGRLGNHYPGAIPLASVSKGIELDTIKVSTQILEDVLGEVPLVALSGPSIAPELAQKLPCAVVAASQNAAAAELVQQAMSNEYFRVYTNNDLIGVELAGATKNVIALAAGIGDGIEAGCNAKAALLTRGMVEITRLAVAMGGQSDTFKGLAGFGDLITTCTSPVSRNRSAGEKIGRGMTTEQAIASTQSVIEGIPTTRALLELAAANKVEMPITEAVGAVLRGDVPPREAIIQLMTRSLKRE